MTENFDKLIETTFGSFITEQPGEPAIGTDPLAQAGPTLNKIKGKTKAGQVLTPQQKKLQDVGQRVSDAEEENQGETLKKLEDMEKQQKAKPPAQ